MSFLHIPSLFAETEFDVAEVRRGFRLSSEIFDRSSRAAKSEFREARSLCRARRLPEGWLPRRFTRRKFCFADFVSVPDDSVLPGCALLCSYWLIHPHQCVIDFICERISRAKTAIERGLSWRVLVSYADVVEQTPVDDVFRAIEVSEASKQIGRENDLAERRRAHIKRRESENIKSEHFPISDESLNDEFADVKSNDRSCVEALWDRSEKIRCAAVWAACNIHHHVECREVAVDLVEAASAEMATIGALALASRFIATEDEYLCREMIRIGRTAESPRTRNLARYALLACCGLQTVLMPRLLLGFDDVMFPDELFDDLA